MEDQNYVKNLILQISGIGQLGIQDGTFDKAWKPKSRLIQEQRVTREILQQVFDPFGVILHINYMAGRDTAVLRFKGDVEKTPEKQTPPQVIVQQFSDNGLVLGGQQVKLEILSGQEEQKIWAFLLKKGVQKSQQRQKGQFKQKH
ncbi:RNA binding motif-containing protein [Spironucleus salmonicida]|uniref:RNA binding motif-containing protein n=1 Tax=Spironucleus salmonicida TaxID=348837 RepID=V6LJ04_9EUKA|nr:RNA binding motif-containing protein [Spironucleus salmonicida]|eukprot:EST44595.1 RNA binding motif-containing protein [Spironucleus salmonicida]